MPSATTRDRVQVHDRDWGHGCPVVFGHGRPLNAFADDADADAGGRATEGESNVR